MYPVPTAQRPGRVVLLIHEYQFLHLVLAGSLLLAPSTALNSELSMSTNGAVSVVLDSFNYIQTLDP